MDLQNTQASTKKTTPLELGECQAHNKPRPCEDCRAEAKDSPEIAETIDKMREADTKVAFDGNCKTHGTPYAKVIETPFGGKIGICMFCVAEQEQRAEEDRKRQKTIEARKKQERLNSTLTNAMIAPRFVEKSFDTFKVESEEQEEILKSCRWFLDNWQRCVGLIFIGNRGTGKNHLASALVKEFVLNKEKTALMTEALKIIRAIKETWEKKGVSEGEVLRRFLEPDLLVIDEIGVQFGTETEKMYLTEIINDRYNWLKPTILMGNVSIEEMEKAIGERAFDRFKEGGGVCSFTWESYRGRGQEAQRV